jgi:hypothetical protein
MSRPSSPAWRRTLQRLHADSKQDKTRQRQNNTQAAGEGGAPVSGEPPPPGHAAMQTPAMTSITPTTCGTAVQGEAGGGGGDAEVRQTTRAFLLLYLAAWTAVQLSWQPEDARLCGAHHRASSGGPAKPPLPAPPARCLICHAWPPVQHLR